MPKVIQVIESELCRGTGKDDDPYRAVRQYHTLEGELLAEEDLDKSSQLQWKLEPGMPIKCRYEKDLRCPKNWETIQVKPDAKPKIESLSYVPDLPPELKRVLAKEKAAREASGLCTPLPGDSPEDENLTDLTSTCIPPSGNGASIQSENARLAVDLPKKRRKHARTNRRKRN